MAGVTGRLVYSIFMYHSIDPQAPCVTVSIHTFINYSDFKRIFFLSNLNVRAKMNMSGHTDQPISYFQLWLKVRNVLGNVYLSSLTKNLWYEQREQLHSGGGGTLSQGAGHDGSFYQYAV